MKVFKIGRNLEVICQSERTSYGFRHLATLQADGYKELLKDKCCYYNRTWECYEFESVLIKLCELSKEAGILSKYHQAKFKRLIKNNWRKDAEAKARQELKTVSMVMAMGDLLAGDSQKAKNDWKARMLKAGLEGRGLIMPNDWNELNENEKERRLNNVIAQLK